MLNVIVGLAVAIQVPVSAAALTIYICN